ncbi:putative oxygenase subunit protein [Stanieria cyanosphaera PCC 7437]|uniref:Oxygenase subunit protein n=1 Tax=Stanieria cyanosphaera (strain ATCC 29371 / PCC 7437) TaxID=111780 RepID=K9XW76_STAC7|nr:styrene monooxygenase/indole monooxygenase family protein [Stanieria cyanosphaera]AFZ36336.1 putative oxygenase subunit protein [Stanieria cyanosphaera PCC 7437]
MRHIGIIGAGQAGLYLGFSLIEAGYRVTLFAERSPEEIFNSQPSALAVLFSDALELERNLGLDFWSDEFDGCEQFLCQAYDSEGNLLLKFSSAIEKPWQAIDQRLKFSLWMQEFVRRGGELIVKTVTIADLEECAKKYDLVVVAGGRGEISRLFERDKKKSIHNQPKRHLAGIIIKNHSVSQKTFKLANLPGIGEIIQTTFFHKYQIPTTAIGFEAYPGGMMDRFSQVQNGQELLAIAKETIKQFLPGDYELIKDSELADPQGWLRGAVTPTVRKPVAYLPSGAMVMGIGDAVILNDPICGQGANSATKMSKLVTQRIIEVGQGSFEPTWIEAVFEEFWQYSQYVNAYADCLLEPPAHLPKILMAMAENPAIVTDYLNGVNHPPALSPWFFKPDAAEQYLAKKNLLI